MNRLLKREPSTPIKMESDLYHYGVKGMKWGVRKEYEPHPRKRRSKFEDDKLVFSKVNNSDKPKRNYKKVARNVAIGVGVVAIAGLSIYAAKKYIDSGAPLTEDIIRSASESDIPVGRESIDKIIDSNISKEKFSLDAKSVKTDAASIPTKSFDVSSGEYVLDVNKSGTTSKNTKISHMHLFKSINDVKNRDLIRIERPEDLNKILEDRAKNTGAKLFFSKDESISYHSKHTFDKTLWDSLSTGERHAIKEYTGDAYKKMNMKLRGLLKNGSSTTTDNYIRDMSSALSKSIVKEPLITHRGVKYKDAPAALGISKEAMSNPEALKSLIGTKITDKGFFSSSADLQASFDGLKFHVYIPKGTQGMYVSPISNFEEEDEFIIQRNTTYQIRDVIINKSGVVTDIMMDVVEQILDK